MNQERLLQVLMSPHVSEKSARIADGSNQIAFKVAIDATKPEVKAAVEMLFKVNVEGVQMLVVKGKRKRHGQVQGRRKDWKKAYVRLQEGQDIDFVGTESA
ncbi:MAG TPA: 50S ribosomal protein L23 [Gammaproteobacteria bacterium]|nr:50S ribosomal protein L23 [Gammaproteobacteria bacterium]